MIWAILVIGMINILDGQVPIRLKSHMSTTQLMVYSLLKMWILWNNFTHMILIFFMMTGYIPTMKFSMILQEQWERLPLQLIILRSYMFKLPFMILECTHMVADLAQLVARYTFIRAALSLKVFNSMIYLEGWELFSFSLLMQVLIQSNFSQLGLQLM